MKVARLFIVLGVFWFTSCNEGRIEITSEYIIDENWGEGISHPIMIEKMKVKKDSTINPYLDLSQGEILSKLMEDSLFRWFGNVNMGKTKEQIHKTKKVYFSKDNGFIWRDDVTGRETEIFGNLERNTWYQFKGLADYPYFVVYVDSINGVHRFAVNTSNW